MEDQLRTQLQGQNSEFTLLIVLSRHERQREMLPATTRSLSSRSQRREIRPKWTVGLFGASLSLL